MNTIRLQLCFAVVLLLLTLGGGQALAQTYTPEELICTMNGSPAQGEFYYGDLAVTLPLDTPEEQENPPCVVVAQYDNRGILINCALGETAEDGASAVAELSVTQVEDTGIRIYVWDGLWTMRPLMQGYQELEYGIGDRAGQWLYLNEDFEDETLTMAAVRMSGDSSLQVADGYARVVRTAAAESCYFNMNFTQTSKHVVLEADFRNGAAGEDTVGNATLFWMRDAVTTGSNNDKGIVSFADGVISDSDKAVTVQNSPGAWTRVSVALNLEDATYDLYYDGVLQAENRSIKNNFNNLSVWRIFFDASDPDGTLEVDNIRAYDGIKPRDITGQPTVRFSIYSDTVAKTLLDGKTALSPYANAIYTDGEKRATHVPCITLGDEALVSVKDFQDFFGVTPTVSGDTVTVGDAAFTVDSTEMKVGGESYTMEAAPRMENGQVMLPVRAYGINVLGEQFYDDGHGMFLVGAEAIADRDYSEANQYLFFRRYSRKVLTEKLMKTLDGDITKHPRLFADAEDFARLREEVKTDAYKKQWYEAVLRQANTYAADSTEFRDYDVSSGRLTGVSGAALREISYCAFAYQITGEQKYADRAIRVMEKVCSYPDWYPEHTLGTGQMAQAVAIGFDWCYDAMTDAQRTQIAEAAKELGLGAGDDVYYGRASYSNKFWGKTDTNWGGVVNGGLMALAAAIAEVDIEHTMQSMANALRSLEYSIYAIAPDGAWHEGPSYWSYYFGQLAVGMAAYEGVFDEVHEAVNYKGMDGMLTFQAQFTDPTGKYNNYNDADLGSRESVARTYIAAKLGDLGVMKQYAENMGAGFGEGATIPMIYGLLWYDPQATGIEADAAAPALDAYYRETEFISMRESWGEADALWVSATGGVSNSSHSHLDSGSYVLTLDGIRWATDLGTEDGYYSRTGENSAVNAGYTNWHYYRRKAEGHNVVVINPDTDLEIDKDAFAQMSAPVSGGGRAYAWVDLGSSHAEEVNSYLRGYLLSENRRAFTVRDEIDLKTDASSLYWFMHTDGTITVEDNQTALITQGGKTLKVQVLVEGDECEYTLCTMPQARLIDLGFEEESNNGEKLTLRMTASGRVNITVKMSMQEEEPSRTPPENTPIAAWSVEE